MRTAAPPAYQYRPSARSRMTSLALSVATCALIVLMLIKMGALLPDRGKRGQRLTAVTLSPMSASTAPDKKRVAGPQPEPAGPPVPGKIAALPPKPKTPVPPPLAFLKISREDFASADISKMARPASGGGENGPARSSASAYGPGEGPGGAKLYNAEWYREPTRAEIATYMPKRDFGSGWATIACRTEEHYRVADCQELSEYPRGSGLSRAMRQAAWQFLVRPPRIDGKPMIGEWVRIRFDFTQTVRGGETPAAPADGN